MKALYILFGILLFLSGCSSSELEENWKNPNFEVFEAKKVLIIGMTPATTIRQEFEDSLVSRLAKHHIDAVSSIRVLDTFISQNSISKSKIELKQLEQALIHNDFDAVLISKITGQENHIMQVQQINNFNDTFKSFRQDYYFNQNMYNARTNFPEYPIYHTETTLYCLCPQADEELVWKGVINIIDPPQKSKAINDYVSLLIWALKEQNLLILSK